MRVVLTLSRRCRDNQGPRQEDQHPNCRPPGWRITARQRYALYTCRSTRKHTSSLGLNEFLLSLCLLCFDAVGWAAGRASGL